MSNTKAKRARFAHIQRLQRFNKELRRKHRGEGRVWSVSEVELCSPNGKVVRLGQGALLQGGAE